MTDPTASAMPPTDVLVELEDVLLQIEELANTGAPQPELDELIAYAAQLRWRSS